jgi:transcriptional regulator with XRE-family HTH domain
VGHVARVVVTVVQRVAQRVRKRRRGLGLSQRVLAARAGLPPETISRLERAQGNPTLGTLDAIARALEADVADLLRPAARKAPIARSIALLLKGQPVQVRRMALALVRTLVKGG